MNRTILLSAATLFACSAASLMLFSGCQTNSDANTIADAQSCLDQATTSSQAQSCAAMVESISSPDASRIRCSADFIEQGFNGTRFTAAFQDMANNGSSGGGGGGGSGSSTDSTVSLMAFLVFTNSYPTTTTTTTDCSASGISSMASLADIVQLSTTVAQAASFPIGNFDPSAASNPAIVASMESAIISIASNPTLAAAAGSTIISMSSEVCASGSSLANQSVCNDINSAISSGDASDPASVTTELVNLLQSSFSN